MVELLLQFFFFFIKSLHFVRLREMQESPLRVQEHPGQESVPSSLIVCTSPYPPGQAISATKVCMPLLQLEQKGGLSVQAPEADGVSSLAAFLLMAA